MKRILVRADDLGYSEGVNYGIIKSVKDGIINNVGVMVNMDATMHGVEMIKNFDVDLGQHTNICIGKPLSDPKLIPSIVGENGYFKPSSEYRNAKEDFVVLEEVIIEIEAQYEKFKEIFQKDPDYFEGHAVSSSNFFKGLELVADKYGLKYSGMSFDGAPVTVGSTTVFMNMDSSKSNYDPFKSLKQIYKHDAGDGVDAMILHPGYLDNFILKNSSLTIPRTLEVEMSINPEVKSWIKENDVILVRYKDL